MTAAQKSFYKEEQPLYQRAVTQQKRDKNKVGLITSGKKGKNYFCDTEIFGPSV
jgi:hypothetical protein